MNAAMSTPGTRPQQDEGRAQMVAVRGNEAQAGHRHEKRARAHHDGKATIGFMPSRLARIRQAGKGRRPESSMRLTESCGDGDNQQHQSQRIDAYRCDEDQCLSDGCNA